MSKEYFVTKKGSELKTNKWEENQSLILEEKTAIVLIKKGFISEQKEEAEEVKPKVKRSTKKED